VNSGTSTGILWWGSVIPYKNHMIRAHTRVFVYLTSSWTTFEHHDYLPSYLLPVVRVGEFVFTGSFRTQRVLIGGFTDIEYSLFFCVF